MLRSKAKSSVSGNCHQLHWLERISGQRDHGITSSNQLNTNLPNQWPSYTHTEPKSWLTWIDEWFVCMASLMQDELDPGTSKRCTKNIWNWHLQVSSAQAWGGCVLPHVVSNRREHGHCWACCLHRGESLGNGTTQRVITEQVASKETEKIVDYRSSFKASIMHFYIVILSELSKTVGEWKVFCHRKELRVWSITLLY